MKNKRKGLILSILGIIGLIVITAGVTYAFFNYVKQGTTDNTVTTGTITFLYTEVSQVGKGISLSDAYPISDSQGKAQTGEGKVFDFKVTSETPTSASIPYEITARKKIVENMLDEEAVKIYLTKVSGTVEDEVLLDNYDNLTQTTKVSSNKYIEKTLHTDKVPADSTNYEQAYRLRMWIDDSINFSPVKDENGQDTYPYNNKTFTVTVNVYADAKVVTEEEIGSESSTEINNILIGNKEAKVVENESYQYEVDILDTSSFDIIVNTKNPNATVEIEKLDSLAYSSNIKRLSNVNTIDLTEGENYLKITVTSEDKETSSSYIIKVNVTIDLTILNADSILNALSNDDLTTGYYDIRVNDESYPAHLYVLDGNQTFTTSKIFGTKSDVATANKEAKRMVIVKVNGDLTIEDNATIMPYYNEYGGPKGFTLYVTGTLTNNGIIDNSHGAKAVGENVYLWKNNDGTYEYVPKEGALGGTEITGSSSQGDSFAVKGNNGNDGLNRETGGGATGGIFVGEDESFTLFARRGGNGTSYSGGTGSGGIDVNQHSGTYYSGEASDIGGIGGSGFGTRYSSSWASRYAGGGAGNPGGLGNLNNNDDSNYSGSNGTGGLLVIYSDYFINSGIISANGSSGGTGKAAGGSSGGGSINVFYNTTTDDLLLKNSMFADGGVSPTTNVISSGGTGGKGTINHGSVATGTYIESEEISREYINIEADSILDAISSSNISSGYYNIKVNDESYPTHLYTLDGNFKFNRDIIVGDEYDVATSDSEAKNMVILKVNGDLTIKEGITLSPYYNEYGGPKGFTLYVTGTLTNNGTIDNSHGAKATGQNVYLWKNNDGTYEYIPAVGAEGGSEITASSSQGDSFGVKGNDGNNGSNRKTGGGATGGLYVGDAESFTVTSKKGGNGTSYSGGSGSGGVDVNHYSGSYYSGEASEIGGMGGSGFGIRYSSSWSSRYGGGGAGNPGGLGNLNTVDNSTYSGSNGTGGLLIIYTNKLINNATISANGSSGGTAVSAGGSSGGGSINIFYSSSYDSLNENASITANGGISPTVKVYGLGGTGGNGSISIGSIQSGTYISD